MPFTASFLRFPARIPALLVAALVMCFISFSAGADERQINIKVAQYPSSFDFTCPQGGSWALGGKTGPIQIQDACKLTGVLQKRAVKRYHVMVASVRATETQKILETMAEWRSRGFSVSTMILGGEFFSPDGRTLLYDNRLANVEVGVFADQKSAQALVDKLASEGKSSWIFEEVVSLSKGTLTLFVNNQEQAQGDQLSIIPQQLTLLKKVEYAVGYPWHGFADRNYRGSLGIRWGAQDAIDCLLTAHLETVLAGVVPSEISPKAEIGALQAQAVAARGEILSKIGQRHVGEGFDTCSEQHCQVFSGESAESITVANKIAPTKGQVLTAPSGRLVDAVYAANCGGHGEACHLVWSTPPDPILSGIWDAGTPPGLDLSEEKQVGVFINNPPDCYCNNASVEGGDKFRWKKAIAGSDWKTIENAISIGRIQKVTDIARGVSGRMYRITFVGERGSKTIMKELNIRKLLGGLRSSCFVANWTLDTQGFITGAELSGAGFGHGVGMCQTGAQSLAKRGWAFAPILSHYFPGSQLKKWY